MKRLIDIMMEEKRDVLLSVLFGVLAGLTSVALFGLSGFMISKSALQPPLYIITIMTALLKLFGAAKAGSRYAERYVSHRATFTILSNLRVSFYEKLEPLAPRIFGKYRSGDLLARIVGDVETLQNFFLRVFYPPLVLVIVFLSTVLFTMFYSVWIALVLLAGLLFTGFIIPGLLSLKQRNVMRGVRAKRAQLSTETTELLYGFRDLKLHQKLDKKQGQLLEMANSYAGEQEKEGVQAAASQSLNAAAALFVSFMVLVLGAYFVTIGELDGLLLAMLVMISLTVFDNAVPMALFPAHFEETRQASSRLFSVVDEPAPAPKKQRLDEERAFSIELKNVTFTYPGEERPALQDVSFKLPAGTKTAIVGPSGSGKSTVLQLLLDMYAVEHGDLFIGETSIRDIQSESIWSQTNVMLQANHFFYGTIKDNLQIAREDVTDEEMKEALRVVELPFSLDDPVLEGAENVSGGEKQRLALARVLLKRARIWLLDEPSSSLDVLTEGRMFNHLLKAAEKDTLLLISHRLTGLEKMDQIIVMENGRIAEAGSFGELMAKQGYFYELKQMERQVIE
ncbi:thiol reductant ABC exporter subunit CydC [Domibacillus enclensis]|uniref:ATP-binding cassette, subfamily C, CydC n=1 Tax=Domibacillus enclensis TaxID=1017273 RepID=A0A1N6XNN6_9BACI|nr:thiol reductant ABC exporter subunit CydC [Domibacillus enclensis]OXS77388.1 thiol reductant ABC exporter subunit CydC [Domibacillus enclensis]SIR03986.1 ATP-binding cassette, subfamily C, CydC [Domibacillus enclensis]